ncbi:protein YLS7 isoform X1 [Tripterygium wilfordii]|uniref:Protein YLS7 isoform X1 n=2 Tax=Tripterygium wilfordii TaxID=458696 RepID=A0A7J7CEK3_TRIWF|nr:protein YLS7 isoform X1 [Tripterygium wilfordii]
MAAFPRSLLSIAISVGGLALFLILASCLLVQSPLGSTVQSYFYGVDSSKKLDISVSSSNQTTSDSPLSNVAVIDKNSPSGPSFELPMISNESSAVKNKDMSDTNSLTSKPDSQSPMSSSLVDQPVPAVLSGVRQEEEVRNGSIDGIGNIYSSNNSGNGDSRMDDNNGDTSSGSTLAAEKSILPLASNASKTDSVDSGCDLYHGSWFYDSLGPTYTNNTCPIITQMQNCQGNGRPDKEYENWRWKPFQCDLPRFDAKKFLELMRGKTLAFIGDSVARNQMESMLCLLWQVEVPKNRGNRKMQRWYFRSTSVMIVRIWSSWLVHQTSGPLDFAPEGFVKLHLDAPDDELMKYIPDFDVVVLSSGHWFAKQSAYVINNEIVGGQLWWPDKSRSMKVNNIEAFGISVETILTALATHPNYTGLAIVRSYSPDHYEGGAWNTGGSCTGKVRPLSVGELVENGFTEIMHKKQVTGFDRAIKKMTNKSKLKLMDITEVFGYRHDGHPGPYRSPDPNKITKRGPDGKPPPQDCLHWCMPGPVDTWNELVLEIIRREFEGKQSS